MKKLETLPLRAYEPLTGAELDTAIDCGVRQTESCLPALAHAFKYSHSVDRFYTPPSENVEWTTGFWTGELWLAYELSHKPCFLEAAQWQVGSFLDRIERRIDVGHHDMGFLYSPSCVASYKLTGNPVGRKAALLAADNLVSRFQEKGQFLQAWGVLGAKDNYRLIIDCLLNLPLLYWATGETGNPLYADIATRHLHTAIKYVLRPDNSTYHTYFFDPETGLPLRGVTAQGYRDGSAWARGQAWGIYGAALAYRYLKDDESLAVYTKVLDFFLEHLPENCIPYWDFDFTDPSTEPRDSSALAIAACGMLEMARVIPDSPDASLYREYASRMCTALWRYCAVRDPSISNGQLLHGTYARKSPYNTCNNRGVDECNTWGDYYYMEALVRLKTDWIPYW